MTRIGKTKANAGETLVEVVASIFIFLILMAIIQGAISYSTASLEKNKQIRQDNQRILEALQTTTESENKTEDIAFHAVGKNGQLGENVFNVKMNLSKKKVSYKNTKGEDSEITFYLFDDVPNTSGTGGGTAP